MSDSLLKRLIIGGRAFLIPSASSTHEGMMSATDFDKMQSLAALAFKSEVAQSDLSSALTSVISGKADSSDIIALQNAIDTLNGSGEGSVAKAVDDAINEFAAGISDDGTSVQLKELVNWVNANGSDATALTAAVLALQAITEGIGGEGEPRTVMEAITQAIAESAATTSQHTHEIKDVAGLQEALDSRGAVAITVNAATGDIAVVRNNTAPITQAALDSETGDIKFTYSI